MIKKILRRFMALVLIIVMIVTLIPNTVAEVYGASMSLDMPSVEGIYLSYEPNKDFDITWNADNTTVTGKISVDKGCSSSGSSTLTMKNQKSEAATLSFEYSVIKNGGSISVNGGTIKDPGTFSKELASGESIEIIITASPGSETSVKLEKVALLAEKTGIETTFKPPTEGGSYTVDGNIIDQETTPINSSSKSYELVATPNSNYQFLGWYDTNTGGCISSSANFSLQRDSNCTITARFVSKELALFETGGQVFASLNEAVDYAQKNGKNKITLTNDGTISGNYTIPAGITLLIPFDTAGTLYEETPDYVKVAETQSAFRTLTMKDGSSITVNGTISVGGKHLASSNSHCCKPTGPYGHIKMEMGSSIVLNNSASLYAWGYITGEGTITAASGSNVYEYFQVTDWRGGNATKDMNNNSQKVFPISQYYVQNIESALEFENGAAEYTYISIEAGGVVKSVTIPFIGGNGLFLPDTGGVLTKKYIPSKDRTEFKVNGDATLNSIAINVKFSTLIRIDIDSKDYVLPINNNISINIESGTTTITKDVALLPGTQVDIAENASLKIEKGAALYVYDESQWNGAYLNGNNTNNKVNQVAYTPTTKNGKPNSRNISDAIIDVNGQLIAEGDIYTTESGADIKSSNGKGSFVQRNTPGTKTTTYQYKQSTSEYIPIEVSPILI